ncbi:RecA-like DNA recombinase [Microbacterium phage AluminumJesus]|nr:RecA-like DNA recombinase [Microbacterium phage AluminumJesus]
MNQPAPYRLEAIQPPSHVRYAHALGRGMLTFQQIEELVKGINTLYVQAKQGKSYLAQHQARAEMNRIFGYGNWDVIDDDPVVIYENFGPTGNDKKERWTVAYRMKVTVNIRDLWGMPVATFTGMHAEENAPQPQRGEAHALAITSVQSYALRRALINLGDRFGLGLYNGGSTAVHGQYTIQQYEGQLGKWVPNEQEPQAQVPIVTHETIRAEPVISDDGTNPNWVDPTQQAAQAPVQQQMAPQQVQQQAPQVMQQAGAPQQQPQQAYVQQQGPTPQGDGTVQGMQQAAQQQAYARQQYTQQQFAVDPSMAARLQQGFKQDENHPRREEAEIAAWEGQG